jgi:rhamnulokinase
VIAARVGNDGVELHRGQPLPERAGACWRDAALGHPAALRERGLRAEGGRGRFPAASAGIDSWGCDYGLLDATGALIGNPVHYRDRGPTGSASRMSASELYTTTGIQHLPFNTIYQLAAAASTPAFASARTLLLIPDLLGYWLTGEVGAE